ncbi:general substrate transporter [Penicillium maclennaniae]|uniref:general substrate transporter n=1 Tax=Penicillium maclennaniae TaxID=1343394 RepID=UPI0025420B7F|nr:general substrate transporter [Penicillium maclennaniae]KAJ5665445.1 general substrate transporter [Penicillium maclennaniae]
MFSLPTLPFDSKIEESRYQNEDLEQKDVHEVQVASVSFQDALAKEQLNPWSWAAWTLYGVILVTTLDCCMNGFDGTLMSSINAMPNFHKHFGTSMEGSGTGLLFSIYSFGNLVGAAFASPISDILGRRIGMFSGSAFIVIGTILEAVASNVQLFMGGRFLIGLGVSISNTAAPVYLVEVAFPQWRGLFGGLYNVVGYYTGAILCTWIAYGTGFLSSNWSWRAPVIIQAVSSVIVMLAVFVLPESPRWLWATGKQEQARKMLIKYHGSGKDNSPLVRWECNQIGDHLQFEIETGGRKWWDFRVLFSSRANLYRLWLIFLVSVFSQFIGGSVISYFMPVMLQNAGITSSSQQLLMNALNTVFSFVSGLVGSLFVDRWGRRSLFLWGTFLTGLIYVPINVLASYPVAEITRSMGYGFIASIFLYGIFFSFTWSNLQALYPAEILPNTIRAKGVAFQGVISGAANFINFYATPTALQNIGWRMYTIFLVFHFLEFALMFFTLPETKGRSIEELNYVFNSRNPVKESLRRTTVLVHEGEGVKGISEVSGDV